MEVSRFKTGYEKVNKIQPHPQIIPNVCEQKRNNIEKGDSTQSVLGLEKP